MENKKEQFADLFKKFRLRSEFATLSEFADALAQEGFVYEDSLFSHWQKGDRIPKERELLICILQVFIKKGGISRINEANELLTSVGQRDLDVHESALFSTKLFDQTVFTAPAEPPYFIGRETYLKEICWHLLNKKTIALYGEAGVGKTYLAIKIAHMLRDRFKDGVLWYRFDIKGVDTILIDIARVFGEDISRLRDKKTKSEIVKDLLAKRNILLILDNVESFEEIDLFLPGEETQYPLLITARLLYTIKSRIKRITLHGFNQKELLDLTKIILGAPFVLMNKEKLKQLGKLIGFSPLATTILMRRIEHDPRALKTFLHHFEENTANIYKAPYDNKTLHDSLNLSFLALPDDAQNFFTALGVFHGADFSKEAAAYINDISPQDAHLKLDDLRKFSLVEYSKDGRWRLHPLIKIFIKDKIKDKNLYERLASYYVQFLSRLGRGNFAHYDNIEKEIDNILGDFKKCYELGYYKRIIDLWEYLGIFLWDKGHWNDTEKYGLIVSKASLRLRDKHALARCFIRELCWLYYWQGNIEKAEKYLKDGTKLAKELNDKTLLALAWIRFGKIYQSKKKCDKAFQYFEQALAYYKQKANREKQGDIYTYIGETYWLIGQHKKAKYHLHRALRIVNTINDIPQKMTIFSRLGCLALQEKHCVQAISYFKKSLLMEKQLGRRVGDTFWNNLALGLTYATLENHQAAREKFQLAKKK